MSEVRAIFRHGVFEPLEPVSLPEDQRVHLKFERADEQDSKTTAEKMKDWLASMSALREKIRQREGILPDSTLDIAEDRRR